MFTTLAIYGVIAVALAIAFLSMGRPGCTLALIWSMFGVEQLLQSKFQLFVNFGNLVNAFPIVTCLIAIFFQLSRGKRLLYVERVQLLTVALFILAIASSVWSVDRSQTTERIFTAGPYLVAFCLVGPLCISNENDILDGLWAFVVLSVPLLIALATVEMDYRHVLLSDGTRGNPLAVGSVASYSSICCFALSIVQRRFWVRIVLLGIVLLGAFVVLRTGSRGQMIGAAISMAFAAYITLSLIQRSSIVIGFFLAGIVLIVVWYAIEEVGMRQLGFDARWERQYMINELRSGRLSYASELLGYYRLGGPLVWFLGLGSSASYSLIGGYCHIVPIEVLCELGLLGLTIFLAIIGWTAFAGISILRSATFDSKLKLSASVLLSLFCFESILQLKQGALLGYFGFFFCCIVISRLANSARYERQHARQTRDNLASPVSRQRFPAN
jgi:O-antigen ligase